MGKLIFSPETNIPTLVIIVIFTWFSTSLTHAQSEEELAKSAQNPVGDLISIPFQNNTLFGIGPQNRTMNVLNIQPVYPIHLGENWNLVTRTIIPIISQPDFSEESGSITGLGDINFTAFFSPSGPSKVIWGIGPSLLLPTATKDLGSG